MPRSAPVSPSYTDNSRECSPMNEELLMSAPGSPGPNNSGYSANNHDGTLHSIDPLYGRFPFPPQNRLISFSVFFCFVLFCELLQALSSLRTRTSTPRTRVPNTSRPKCTRRTSSSNTKATTTSRATSAKRCNLLWYPPPARKGSLCGYVGVVGSMVLDANLRFRELSEFSFQFSERLL